MATPPSQSTQSLPVVAAAAAPPAPEPARRIPRPRLVGGFVIKHETLVNWARRLKGRRPDSPMNGGSAYLALWRKVQSFGCVLQPIGEDDLETGDWMVVTQIWEIDGWKGMDRALVPELKEEEMEELAKKKLQEQGITPDEYEFRAEVTGDF